MKDNLNNPFNVMRHKNWDNAPREVVAQYLIALGLPTAVAYVVAFVGLTMVASWVTNALMPDIEGQKGLLTNTRDAAAPQDIVYGEVRKGGSITYLEATGDDNEYLHMILTLAGHEISSIDQIYLNDQEVTISSSTNFVTTSDWVNDSEPKVYIRKFLGSPNQNIYSDLNGIANGPDWQGKDDGDDVNFRGQGVACLYVRMKYNSDVFAQGIPLVTARIKGKKVFDPRDDTTGYSANAALCIRDYLVSKYGLDADGEIDDTSFETAANVCDENVSLAAGGTEKRYEMNGATSLSSTPGNILNRMMTTCAGNLFWGQGKWVLKAGEYNPSVQTFTLSDLRGEINLATKASRRDNFNIVRGKFVSADDDYVQADYPEIKSSTFITEDNGFENALDLELPLTTSHTMAQRLAKMTLYRAREQMTLQANFSMKAFDVQVGDVVALTIERYGFTTKEFEVIGWTFQNDPDDGGQTVGLTLRETSEAAFLWSAEETDLAANDSTLPSLGYGLTISNLAISQATTIASDGTFFVRATATWTAASTIYLHHYNVRWKQDGGEYSESTTSGPAFEFGPLLDSEVFEFEVQPVTEQNIRGTWTSVSFTAEADTTAPGVPTSVSATGGFQQVVVDWNNPTDNDFARVQIYRASSDSSSSATLIGETAGSFFTDSGLADSTQYYYFLKSQDFTGNLSSFTASVNATTIDEIVLGTSIVAVYASNSSGSNKSFSAGSLEYILYHEYTGDRPELSSINGTWIKFVGEDGAQGAQGPQGVQGQQGQQGEQGEQGDPGSDGDPGARYATVRYYAESSTSPSTASLTSNVSYNWSTAVASTSYGVWSKTSPTIAATTAANFWFVDITFRDTTGEASSSSGNAVTTPARLLNFNGLVTFTNTSGTTSLQDAIDDDATTIDAGKITTGTLDATNITVANLSATSIQTGELSAARLNLSGTQFINSSGALSLKDSGISTSLVQSNAITKENHFSRSSQVITGYSISSVSLGSFSLANDLQSIIILGACNLYGTGSDSSYSVALHIDGSATSTFVNGSSDDYSTIGDIRFPATILDRRIYNSGTHSLSLNWIVPASTSLTIRNLDVVIFELKR